MHDIFVAVSTSEGPRWLRTEVLQIGCGTLMFLGGQCLLLFNMAMREEAIKPGCTVQFVDDYIQQHRLSCQLKHERYSIVPYATVYFDGKVSSAMEFTVDLTGPIPEELLKPEQRCMLQPFVSGFCTCYGG